MVPEDQASFTYAIFITT